MCFIIVALVIIGVLIICNVKMVPQATECVVEFLGKYKETWQAGIHIKIPFLEAIVKRVTLKEQVLDSPPQPVITKDNVTMQIDSVVYFQVFDAKLYTYGAVDPMNALENLSATTLRNIVGDMALDETLTSRDKINGQMTVILDKATDKWGIKVNRVELKNIIPPKDIQVAMEKQMKAERDKREETLRAEAHKISVVTKAEGDKAALILAAEGERDASIAKAEGEAKALLLKKQAEADGLAAVMSVHPDKAVLELKKYEALMKSADGQATKLIIPTNMVEEVSRGVVFGDTVGIGERATKRMPVVETPVVDECCDKYSDQAKAGIFREQDDFES